MTEPHHDATDDATVTSVDVATAEHDAAAAVADPQIRDAVRSLNELCDLPPGEHVEVYEAVHSSLQESLADASRQADEPPAGRNAGS